MMTEEAIKEAMPLIRLARTKFKFLPKGISEDDLESAGNQALAEAAIRYDETAGVSWKNYAYQRIKFAMRSLLDRHKKKPNPQSLQPEIDGAMMPPPADAKAAEPSAIVEARSTLSVTRILDRMPLPSVVADRASKLQEAMFDAVAEDDMAEIMKRMVSRAKDGDLAAAKFVTGLVANANRRPIRQQIAFFNGNPNEVC